MRDWKILNLSYTYQLVRNRERERLCQEKHDEDINGLIRDVHSVNSKLNDQGDGPLKFLNILTQVLIGDQKLFFQRDCTMDERGQSAQRQRISEKMTTLAFIYHEHGDVKVFPEESICCLGIKTLFDSALDDFSLHNHDFFQIFLSAVSGFFYDKMINGGMCEIPEDLIN